MGILKNLVIAVTGTLPADTSQLKKWIEANDGHYSPHVRKGVTHLITGKDAWKGATDAVQAARKVGTLVVSYDWLEDSLQKRRKLAETKYTWEYLWQDRKRRREMKRLGLLIDAKKFNQGCEEAKKATGTGTSKSRRTIIRKPKPSKSFFFADVVNVPFVSAADDLKRRREEREAAKAKKAEETAAKKIEEAKADRATSAAPSLAQSSTSNAGNLPSPLSATSRAISTTSFQPASPASGAQAKKVPLKDLYHYYLDNTGFEYKIVLTRCNLRANEITRYKLSILESHTKPHVYCTLVEYFPPGGRTTSLGDGACIQALFDFNNTFHEGLRQTSGTSDVSTDDGKGLQAVTSQTHLPLPQQGLHNHLQATYLRSHLAPPTPSATLPYKKLITPMNSTFRTAWRDFRHAFRDLTLLSWEERFDITKMLYKSRAQHFNTEPFVYVRPKEGLPLGLRVQEAGLFQNQTLARMDKANKIITDEDIDKTVSNDNDDAYAYNSFDLPALSHPLGPGIIGTAVHNDIDAARKAAEKQTLLAEEAEEVRMRKAGLARKVDKKPNYSRPLFNGITGRPTTDAWGRYKKVGGGMDGPGGVGGSGLKGGGVVKKTRTWAKPFPYESGRL